MIDHEEQDGIQLGLVSSICLTAPHHCDVTTQVMSAIDDDGEAECRIGSIEIPSRPDAMSETMISFMNADGRTVHVELSPAACKALADVLRPKHGMRLVALEPSRN